MEPVDTLVSARWVMPVEPDGRVLEHHSVAIRSGRIEAVLPTAEARLRYDARETLDRPHHVLLPGLVNAHTPAAMVQSRWVDPEYVRDGTELAIAEMLRGGITCFADMHLWPDVVARTAAAAQMRASVGLVVTEAATSWATTADEYIDRGMRLRDEYKGDPLISTHFAPHSPYSASDGTLARVRRLADELDLPVAVHRHETAVEVEQSLQACGKRPLARLAALGLASPQLVAIHMTQVEPEDLDLLAEARASVVHCPESNLKLGAGVCPVARLLGRGIRVALGTDGAASNNDLDLLAEARIAGFVSAGVAATPGELIASDLVRMATLEGAQTLGLGEVTGSLVPGKWADLCCIDLRAPRSWPVHDVATAVIYAASSQQVTDTWVAGRRLLADGRLRTVDESAVLERAEAWAARLDATAPNEDPANG
ncbi:MAG: 5-methylthioadenosine/S-adenosylhomocysteine deaminase [Pseudomonadota bacterium]|nr:5-methylthioadenosine/S-adenosylhomocysteine deaminase [Pseudomonadota bacterium]